MLFNMFSRLIKKDYSTSITGSRYLYRPETVLIPSANVTNRADSPFQTACFSSFPTFKSVFFIGFRRHLSSFFIILIQANALHYNRKKPSIHSLRTKSAPLGVTLISTTSLKMRILGSTLHPVYKYVLLQGADLSFCYF